MKISTLAAAFAAILAIGSVVPSVAEAASAKHPYRNVNRSNDRGNRTGDAAVERLNQQQLEMHRNGQ